MRAPAALLVATARLDLLRWCAQAHPRNPLLTVEFRDRAPPCARHRPVDAACLGRVPPGHSHATRNALKGNGLRSVAFGGSASSPSSAADLVKLQLVLRCGQRPGVCGRRCRQLPAHTCNPLTAALCTICCCTALWDRPPPPSPSAAQSPPPSSPPPALFLDDSVQLSAAAAAAGRCQAARSYSWRRPTWLRRRSSAPCALAIFGRLRRVARALSGGSGGAARLACSPGGLRRAYVKKVLASQRVFSRCTSA